MSRIPWIPLASCRFPPIFPWNHPSALLALRYGEACAGGIHTTGRRPQDSSALAGGAGTGGPGVKCAAKVWIPY